MKLPTDKKERVKILGLILIGAGAVLYAVVQLVVLPMIESHKATLEVLAAKRETLDTMNRALQQEDRRQKEHRDVVAQIDGFTRKSILQPKLGSYLIVVREKLEYLAAKYGIQIDPPFEVGRAEIPGRNKDGSKRALSTYGIRVVARGGYGDLTRFFAELEKENTMLCITDFEIVGREATPEVHQIGCAIQWPIWGEPEKPEPGPSAGARSRAPKDKAEAE